MLLNLKLEYQLVLVIKSENQCMPLPGRLSEMVMLLLWECVWKVVK
jgi:hypothetical protein